MFFRTLWQLLIGTYANIQGNSEPGRPEATTSSSPPPPVPRVTSPYFQKSFSRSLIPPFCYLPLQFAKQHANPSAGEGASNPVSDPEVKGRISTHPHTSPGPSLPSPVTVSIHTCHQPTLNLLPISAPLTNMCQSRVLRVLGTTEEALATTTSCPTGSQAVPPLLPPQSRACSGFKSPTPTGAQRSQHSYEKKLLSSPLL